MRDAIPFRRRRKLLFPQLDRSKQRWRNAWPMVLALAFSGTGGYLLTDLLSPLSGSREPVQAAIAASDTIVGQASVIDGDTPEIHGTRIRLHGIDAPESAQLCIANGSNLRCGQCAATALSDEIGNPNTKNRNQTYSIWFDESVSAPDSRMFREKWAQYRLPVTFRLGERHAYSADHPHRAGRSK